MKLRVDVKPVLKWAGGKRQLLDPILAFVEEEFPGRIETYFEPFAGGAAVFFALSAEKKFEHAKLSDKNEDLLRVYRELRDNADELIRELGKLCERGDGEDIYYEVRGQRPKKDAARAARLIYLNRTGYNGLYRVNRSGGFNVPYGRYKNPRILDPSRLRAAAMALQGVELCVEDFALCTKKAKHGDFVYFDPPYLPVSKTASFAEYHSEAFTLAEHQRLAKEFGRLCKKGISVLLSNSDTPETRDLYAKFETKKVNARRAINSNASRRGAVSELLVRGSSSKTELPALSRARK
ncbi:MAG TPA: DNA adenine methylase [Polyangiaceae bacterium]|jgi:DNA adenine methylase|nr:DNA adenine methylase [Polyangiaceae bacterium]